MAEPALVLRTTVLAKTGPSLSPCNYLSCIQSYDSTLGMTSVKLDATMVSRRYYRESRPHIVYECSILAEIG